MTTKRAFEILALPQSATLAQITAAHHRLARERHPDQTHGSNDAMIELNDAVAIATEWYYSNSQLVVVPNPHLRALSAYETPAARHTIEETVSKTRDHLVSGPVNSIRRYRYMAAIFAAAFCAVLFLKDQFPFDVFIQHSTSAEITENARLKLSLLRREWLRTKAALTEAARSSAQTLLPHLPDEVPSSVVAEQIQARLQKNFPESLPAGLASRVSKTMANTFAYPDRSDRPQTMKPSEGPDRLIKLSKFVEVATSDLTTAAIPLLSVDLGGHLPDIPPNRLYEIVDLIERGSDDAERQIGDLLTIRQDETRRIATTGAAIVSFLALVFSGLGWWLYERRLARLSDELHNLEDETATKSLLYHFLAHILQQRVKQTWTIFDLEEAVRLWADHPKQQFADLARTLGFRNFARFLLARAQQIDLISIQIVAGDDYCEYYSVTALASEHVNEDSHPTPNRDFGKGD